eukprot:Plantae.Rhodophyta-Hildenbrandia_rubra.ctg5275.p2 GENE.Plantae.Rhodophyta-Hildenbrandia_rubra.ctg5275~~Plantae.Rhodophyta-Hildenbrandia_rubra.ctg5275.p2  ORF type:complete len:661 (+),score=128.19 Plantae.Rhodophyta-Hildenbrandia_rubra.ctg5275:2-1984(+)
MNDNGDGLSPLKQARSGDDGGAMFRDKADLTPLKERRPGVGKAAMVDENDLTPMKNGDYLDENGYMEEEDMSPLKKQEPKEENGYLGNEDNISPLRKQRLQEEDVRGMDNDESPLRQHGSERKDDDITKYKDDDDSPLKLRGTKLDMESHQYLDDSQEGDENSSQALLSQMQCTPVDQGINRTPICPSPVTVSKSRQRRNAFLTPMPLNRRSLFVQQKREDDASSGAKSSGISPCGLVDDSQETDGGSITGGDPFIPEMSQDTLALFPPIVRQNGMSGGGRNRTGNAIARASIVATLNNTPAMSNPYENSKGLRRGRRLTGSPVSDMDLSNDIEPFNLAGADMNKNETEQRTEQVKAIKRLIVASKEPRYHSLDFEVLDVAGEGSFSFVFKVRSRMDGAVYAVKRNKKPMTNNDIHLKSLREVYTLAALQSHPNIVRYYSSWLEGIRAGEFLCIQTEFFEEGSLAKSLMKKNERVGNAKLTTIARDIAQALEYMHSCGLVHLDVKPDNIFQGFRGFETVYVLGDFGLACRSDGSDGVTDGDARYLAFEALKEYESQESEENTKARLESRDIFSLGATLYELATGVPNETHGEQWNWLRTAEAALVKESLLCGGVREEMACLIVACLAKEPSCRPTAAQLVHLVKGIISHTQNDLTSNAKD